MPNFHPISIDRYANKRWRRVAGYSFAAHEAIVPLTAGEFPRALLSLPIAFVEQNETFIPVAVLGVATGRNLFVAPDGRWVGKYVPAVIRSYPFGLANTNKGQQVLCIDEDSGLIGDGGEGEPFFDDAGGPSSVIQEVLNFLTQIENSRQLTVNACSVLKKHALIKAWPITVKTQTGDQPVGGLFQIDEAVLNQLSAEALREVAQAGALVIAYCQLLSMQQLPVLGELAEAYASAASHAAAHAPASAASQELTLDYLNKNETLSFSGLR